MPKHCISKIYREADVPEVAAALERLEHPNIVKVGFKQGTRKVHELEEVSRLKIDRPNEEMREWARGLLLAVQKYHSEGLVHGDLTPGNLYMSKSGDRTLKIGPLEVFRSEDQTQSSSCYYKPGKRNSMEGDRFSAGQLLLFLATCKQPASLKQYFFRSASFGKLVKGLIKNKLTAEAALDSDFFEEDIDPSSLVIKQPLRVPTSKQEFKEEFVQRVQNDAQFERERNSPQKQSYELLEKYVIYLSGEGARVMYSEVTEEMESIALDSLKAGVIYQKYKDYRNAHYCYFRSLLAYDLAIRRKEKMDDWNDSLCDYRKVCQCNLTELKARMPDAMST